MEYSQLKVYAGPKSTCDQCGTVFEIGDVISVADGGRLVFCYSADERTCLQSYLMRRGAMCLAGVPMRYRNGTDVPAKPQAARQPSESVFSRFAWGCGHVLFWLLMLVSIVPVGLYAGLAVDLDILLMLLLFACMAGWIANLIASGPWSNALFILAGVGLWYLMGWAFLIWQWRMTERLFARFRSEMRALWAESGRRR